MALSSLGPSRSVFFLRTFYLGLVRTLQTLSGVLSAFVVSDGERGVLIASSCGGWDVPSVVRFIMVLPFSTAIEGVTARVMANVIGDGDNPNEWLGVSSCWCASRHLRRRS